MGTSVPPPAPRVRAPGIGAVAADPILLIAAMAAVAEITQEQVDADDKKLEDYATSVARANAMILHHTDQKDMMSLWRLDSPVQKCVSKATIMPKCLNQSVGQPTAPSWRLGWILDVMVI